MGDEELSIRPIDFNGMIQNTQEVGSTRAQEEHRPLVQQETAMQTAQQEVEVSVTQVHEQGDAAAESELDADNGNGSGYQGNRRRKRSKKKAKVSDGSVSVKNGHASFDMKI